MKTQRRYFAMMLALVMVLASAGCGMDSDEYSLPFTPEEPATITWNIHVQNESGDDISDIAFGTRDGLAIDFPLQEVFEEENTQSFLNIYAPGYESVLNHTLDRNQNITAPITLQRGEPAEIAKLFTAQNERSGETIEHGAVSVLGLNGTLFTKELGTVNTVDRQDFCASAVALASGYRSEVLNNVCLNISGHHRFTLEELPANTIEGIVTARNLVTGDPLSADITIAGEHVGMTPETFTFDNEEMTKSVEITKPDYAPCRYDVEFDANFAVNCMMSKDTVIVETVIVRDTIIVTKTDTIFVPQPPDTVVTERPIAIVKLSPTTVERGREICFDGTDSRAPEGSVITNYQWQIEGFGSSSDEEGCFYAPDEEGTYDATLRVRASNGLWSRPDTESYTVIKKEKKADTLSITLSGMKTVLTDSARRVVSFGSHRVVKHTPKSELTMTLPIGYTGDVDCDDGSSAFSSTANSGEGGGKHCQEDFALGVVIEHGDTIWSTIARDSEINDTNYRGGGSPHVRTVTFSEDDAKRLRADREYTVLGAHGRYFGGNYASGGQSVWFNDPSRNFQGVILIEYWYYEDY